MIASLYFNHPKIILSFLSWTIFLTNIFGDTEYINNFKKFYEIKHNEVLEHLKKQIYDEKKKTLYPDKHLSPKIIEFRGIPNLTDKISAKFDFTTVRRTV